MASDTSAHSWLAAIALGASLNNGCAIGTGFLELTDLNFADRTRTRRSPIGQREREVTITPSAIASFRLSCASRGRNAQERVTDESFTFTPPRRVVMAVAAAAEGTLSAYALAHGFGDHPDKATDLGVAISVGADAVSSLLLALFLREQHAITDIDHEGPWSAEPGCPEGLAVERDNTRYRVNAAGELAPEDSRALISSLVEHGGSARISVGRACEDVIPTVATRCAWAAAMGHPAAGTLCPTGGPGSSRAEPWGFTVTLRVY